MVLTDPEITKLTEKQAANLIRLYEQGEARIQEQIATATLKGNSTRHLKTVQANIKRTRNELLVGGRSWCDKVVPAMYREGMSYADSMAFDTHMVGGFGAIHQEAVQQLSEAMYGRLEDVDRVIGRKADDLLRQAQLDASLGSVLGSESIDQASQRMQEELIKNGLTGFVDKAGRNWKISTYADMATHQVTMDSFRQGSKLRLQEHGYDLVVISTHSNPCPKCAPWQGRTVSLSGATPGYPTLEDARAGGLLHVRCRHCYTLSPDERERRPDR